MKFNSSFNKFVHQIQQIFAVKFNKFVDEI